MTHLYSIKGQGRTEKFVQNEEHVKNSSSIYTCHLIYFFRMRFKKKPQARNLITTTLSVLAGILLIISGTQGPIGIYEFILQKLPLIIKNELLLSIAGTIALVLISISLLGGFVVIAGGYLIHKGHGTTGKLAIGLGAGVGIPWLIIILLTLVTAQDTSSVLAQHSIIGWVGIITAFVARYIAK